MTFKTEQKEFLIDKIQELNSVGYTQREIAIELKISLGTCNKYIQYLKQRSKDNIARYLDIELPNAYFQTLTALDLILKEAYLTSKETTIDRRTKLHALALAQSCLSMKVELLNSGTIVDRAIKFVQSHNKDRGSSNQNNQLDIEDTTAEEQPAQEQDKDNVSNEY